MTGAMTERLDFYRVIIPELYLVGCSTRPSKLTTTASQRLPPCLPSHPPPHKHWDWIIELDSLSQVSYFYD